MRAPRTALPATTPVRTGPPGGVEAASPVWLWHGSGPALTPRGLVPLQIEGAAPAVVTAHGPGLRIERGTTNFVTNPSFEVDLSGWSAVAGAAISRQTSGGGAFGDAYARVDVTSTGHGIRVTGSGNAAQGDTYAASMHLRAASPSDIGKTVQVYLDAPGGTYEIFAADHVLTEAWSRVVIAASWAQSGHTGWGLLARSAFPQGTFAFDMDGAQYEPGLSTSYADGSLGTGYAWSATAHGSPSLRSGAVLRAGGAINARRIQIAFAPFWPANDGRRHVVAEIVGLPSRYIRVAAETSGEWHLSISSGDATATVAIPQAHSAGQLIALTATWDGGVGRLRVDALESVAEGLRLPLLRTVTLGATNDVAGDQLDGVLHGTALWAPQQRGSQGQAAPILRK